eukprot:1512377-Rhodomonas_salina.1
MSAAERCPEFTITDGLRKGYRCREKRGPSRRTGFFNLKLQSQKVGVVMSQQRKAPSRARSVSVVLSLTKGCS